MPDYSSINLNPERIGGLNVRYAGGIGAQGGNWVGSAQGFPNPADDLSQRADDIPAFDALSGVYINKRNKRPWNGKIGGGLYVQAGKPTADPGVASQAQINPNDPNQRYKAVNIPKQSDVAAQTSDLLTTFKQQADASLQDFSKYLNDFKSNLGTAKTAATEASSPGTVNREAADMQAQQKQYASSLSASQRALADLNAQTAAQEQGAVSQAQALLPSYDAAGQAIADRQMQAVIGNLSRYKMGTGTPGSAGSDESRILSSAAADVLLPLERDKINKRYDIISNLQLPVTRDIAGRETSRIAQFDPMVAGEKFRTGIATDKDVQALRDQVRNMTYEDAVRFMQASQIPVQIQQQILSGQIGQLGQLSALESGANYQGLQDVLGANINPAQYYNQQAPGDFPTFPSRYGPTGGTGTLAAPNAPVEVGASATRTGSVAGPAGPGVWDQASGGWWNPATGQFTPYSGRYGDTALAATPSRSTGSQSNSYYDAARGVFIDRTTGAITGYGSGGNDPGRQPLAPDVTGDYANVG